MLNGIRDFFINTAQKFFGNLPEEPDFFVEPTQLRLKIFILLGYIVIRACQKRNTPLKTELAPFALDFYDARSSFIPAVANLIFYKDQPIYPNTGAATMGNTKTTSTTEANVNGASEMNETNEAHVNGTHENTGMTTEQTETSEAPAALTKNQKKRMRQKKNKEAKDKVDEAENTTAATQGQVNGYEDHATTEAEVKNGEGVEQESNIEVAEGQLDAGDAHATTQSEIKKDNGKEEESNPEVIEGELDEDDAHATTESEVKKGKGKDEESDEEDCFAGFAGWLKRRDEEFEDKTESTEDEPSGDTEGKGKETETNTGGIGDDLTGNNQHATAESEDEDDDMYGPANPVAATTRVLPTIVGSTGITASAHRPPRPRPNITRPANYPETRSPFEPLVASAHRPPRPRPDITRPTQNTLLFNETYSAHGAALAAAARGTSALTPVIHETENTTTGTAASAPFAQPIQGTTHFDNPPRLGHGFFDPAAASFGLTGPPDPNVPGTTMLNTHGIEPVYEMATQALAMYGGRPLPGLSNFLGVPTRPRARAPGPARRPTMRHVPFMPVPLSHFDEPAAAASAEPLPTAASRPIVAAAAAPLAAPVVAPAAANAAPAPPSRRLPRATRAGANARQALADEIEAVWAANAHLPPTERQAAWAAARQRLLQGDTLAAARRQAGLRQTATAATQEAVRPEGAPIRHRWDGRLARPAGGDAGGGVGLRPKEEQEEEVRGGCVRRFFVVVVSLRLARLGAHGGGGGVSCRVFFCSPYGA